MTFLEHPINPTFNSFYATNAGRCLRILGGIFRGARLWCQTFFVLQRPYCIASLVSFYMPVLVHHSRSAFYPLRNVVRLSRPFVSIFTGVQWRYKNVIHFYYFQPFKSQISNLKQNLTSLSNLVSGTNECKSQVKLWNNLGYCIFAFPLLPFSPTLLTHIVWFGNEMMEFTTNTNKLFR